MERWFTGEELKRDWPRDAKRQMLWAHHWVKWAGASGHWSPPCCSHRLCHWLEIPWNFRHSSVSPGPCEQESTLTAIFYLRAHWGSKNLLVCLFDLSFEIFLKMLRNWFCWPTWLVFNNYILHCCWEISHFTFSTNIWKWMECYVLTLQRPTPSLLSQCG